MIEPRLKLKEIDRETARALFDMGAPLITTGNSIWVGKCYRCVGSQDWRDCDHYYDVQDIRDIVAALPDGMWGHEWSRFFVRDADAEED